VFRAARWRLVVSYTLILSVLLCGLSVTVYIVYQKGLFTDADQSLQLFTNAYAKRIGANALFTDRTCYLSGKKAPPARLPDFFKYTLEDCHGRVVKQTPPFSSGAAPHALLVALLNHKSGLETIRRAGHYWRVDTIPVTGINRKLVGELQLYQQADSELDALHRLQFALLVGGFGSLLLASGAGFLLADRTLRPIKSAFDHERRFIADASHELRTPLALIRTSAEMAARSIENLDEDDAALLHDIVGEADRMSLLVTDLLTLARVDNSEIEMHKDPIDVTSVAQVANRDIMSLAQQRGVNIRVRVGTPRIVLGDELRLRQLMLILLDNAIKYCKPGGIVETRVSGDEQSVTLTVIDTGIGISREALPHIFDRFYRADKARTHTTGGVGLGLSIARWIVTQHDGSIRINSKPGMGTRVRVRLPTAEMAGAEIA
jgi:two-component system sensor histidine kinase CiaH